MQVAIPEFDGRIVGGAGLASRSRCEGDSPVGDARPALRARPRALRARWPRLAVRPRAPAHAADRGEQRIAIVLSSFPTKHARDRQRGRARHAGQRDRAARARCATPATRVEHDFADGDELIHALIAAGGHDPEFLTDEQLAAATARLPVAEYVGVVRDAARRAARGDDRDVGPAAGRAVRRRRRLRDRRPAARQRLRRDPAAARLRREPGRRSTTTPSSPPPTTTSPPTAGCAPGSAPTRSSTSASTARWSGCRARRSGSRAACAPDAALGRRAALLPVRGQRPGRGRAGQAPRPRRDRRPPRAADDARRDLRRARPARGAARRVRALRGARPAQAARRSPRASGRCSHEADLHRDLDIDERAARARGLRRARSSTSTATCARSRTCRSATACTSSAARREGEQCAGCWRRSCGSARATCPACGAPSARPTASTSRRCSRRRRRRASTRRRRCWRASGAVDERRDLVDRLEDAQSALLDASPRAATTPPRRRRVHRGARPRGRRRRARAALRRREVVPRLRARPTSSTTCSAACAAATCRPARRARRPAGASTCCRPGATSTPSTRARCRRELAYEVGRRLADALLRRHLDETARCPETVGIVVWGTAAMRTAGRRRGRDPRAARRAADVAPRDAPRRPGSRSIPLEELGRPRIDVTVRISGFFRDAFPHLVTLLDDAVASVAGLDEPVEQNFVAQARAAPTPSGSRPSWATTRPGGARPRASSAAKPGHLRRRAPAAARRRATGATTPTSPRSTRPGAATPTAAAWTACEARERDARATSPASTSRSRTSTRASTTSSTPTTTSRARRDDRLRAPRSPGATRGRSSGDSSDPSSACRAVAGRGGAARVPLARGQPALDRLDDPPRLQGRVRALGHRRLPVRLRRHRRRGRGLDVRAGRPSATSLDDDVRDFMRRSNPWALRAIAERLLEAADRGLWAAPEPTTLEALRERLPRRSRASSRRVSSGRMPIVAIRSRGWMPRGGDSLTAVFPFTAIVGQEDAARGAAGVRGRPARSAACSCAASAARRSRPPCAALAPLLPDGRGRRRLPLQRRPGAGRRGLPGRPARRGGGRAPSRAPLVELPLGATRRPRRSARSTSTARCATASAAFEPGLLAARAPRDALRRRGQPAARPPRRRAARRGRARAACTSSARPSRSTHAARFLLVGTMNPEEGELRPQLLDRFGLGVEVAARTDPADARRDRAPAAGLRARPRRVRARAARPSEARWRSASPPRASAWRACRCPSASCC